MDNKELTKKEIDILNDVPFVFELEYNKEKTVKEKKFFGLISKNKKVKEKVKEKFKIYPLRLSTMDRMAKYQVDLYINKTKFNEESQNPDDAFNEMKLIAVNNAEKLASIVTIAVLGVNYTKKKFNKLKQVLFDNLTPYKLNTIVNEIISYQSLTNFTHSTAAMSVKTTISPNEVE